MRIGDFLQQVAALARYMFEDVNTNREVQVAIWRRDAEGNVKSKQYLDIDRVQLVDDPSIVVELQTSETGGMRQLLHDFYERAMAQEETHRTFSDLTFRARKLLGIKPDGG